MSSLNQFKLLKQKCKSYFNILEKDLGKKINISKESNQERFGFYIYILENLTQIKDINVLCDLVTDTEFNNEVFSDNTEDFGIDAIFINEEDKQINLFNFKYREKFNIDSKHKENDIFTSTKFVTSLINENVKTLDGKLKKFAEKIIKHQQSNDIWKFKLYMISNEVKKLDLTRGVLPDLEKIYGLELESITLEEISNYMSLRPEPINSILTIEKEAILSYSEDSLSTTKSYILKLPIYELIRITCNNKGYRQNYSLEDVTCLTKVSIDYGVLFDNVRGYLGETKFNKNIFTSLKEEPNRFFMYNNGLTLTTKGLEVQPINANKKMKLELEDIQVVNGGQTLRTLHKFNLLDEKNLEESLVESEILVRIFKTGNDKKLTSRIAEYTNSQNAISPIDIKSIAYEQIQIEQFLDDNDIIYARKVGDTGLSKDKEYKHKISMEKFGQILFSRNGYPEKVSNQKKKIFEKEYYDIVFGEENFNLEESALIVERFFEIQKIYSESKYDVTDQKLFYIVYLDNKIYDKSLTELIEELERILILYRREDTLPPARKLIQKGFKDFLDKNSFITEKATGSDSI